MQSPCQQKRASESDNKGREATGCFERVTEADICRSKSQRQRRVSLLDEPAGKRKYDSCFVPCRRLHAKPSLSSIFGITDYSIWGGVPLPRAFRRRSDMI